MSRAELIKQLKIKNPELNTYDLEEVFEFFCENLAWSLQNNLKVEIRGFGSFFIKNIKEKHSARNPKTGEIIYVPEKNKVRFRPSKKLRKLINKCKNQKYLLLLIQPT